MVHVLKILSEHFTPVMEGKKLAELRNNDRNFKMGDYLHLREYSHDSYTGKSCIAEVIHVADVNAYLKGFVLLSIKLVK